MASLPEHLEHQLYQCLVESGRIGSQGIRISIDDGMVTLRGEVSSFREKLSAQQIIRGHAEVERVNNLLQVATADQIGDSQLVLEIHQMLRESIGMAAGSLQVACQTGGVLLTGYLSHEEEKSFIDDVVNSVAGVRETNNLLIVNQGLAVSNQEHAIYLSAEIQRVIGMEATDVIVSVVDESAQLSGIVDAIWKKESAEKTVRENEILNVSNDLIVRPRTDR